MMCTHSVNSLTATSHGAHHRLMAHLGDPYRQSVATFLANQGRGTSDAVARKLFEFPPDDFGLDPEAPADAQQLAALCAQLAHFDALPANDTARPAAAAAAPAVAPAERARRHTTDTGTGAPFARPLGLLLRERGATMRKCAAPELRSGHYATHWVVVTAASCDVSSFELCIVSVR